MTLSEELKDYLEKIVTQEPTWDEVYTMLTRCFLELRSQEHEIRVLKDKLNAGSE